MGICGTIILGIQIQYLLIISLSHFIIASVALLPLLGVPTLQHIIPLIVGVLFETILRNFAFWILVVSCNT